MEILSDTVFHGDVSIGTSTNPKTLKLYINGNGNVLTIGQTGGTEILKTDGFAKFGTVNADYLTTRNLDLSTPCGTASISLSGDNLFEFNQQKNSNNFYFGQREPGKTYYIATQDQIPSMCGVAHIQELPINFNVPAECTRFQVPGANCIDAYSIQLFKINSDGNGYTIKTIDFGTVCATDGNPAIVVEKSSSFAMCSTDGYFIRLVY